MCVSQDPQYSRSDCVVLVGGGRRAVRFTHSRTKVFANMCMYRIIYSMYVPVYSFL